MKTHKNNGGFGGNGFKGGFKNRGGGFRDRNSGGRDFGGKAEMHEAVCAGCGKTCEVPFRPNGKKPVYCKECFAAQGGGAPERSSERPSERPLRDFPRRDNRDDRGNREMRNDRGDFGKKFGPMHIAQESHANHGNLDDLKKQFEIMNSKLDRLISLAEAFLPKKETVVSDKIEKAPKISKKPSKKK